MSEKLTISGQIVEKRTRHHWNTKQTSRFQFGYSMACQCLTSLNVCTKIRYLFLLLSLWFEHKCSMSTNYVIMNDVVTLFIDQRTTIAYNPPPSKYDHATSYVLTAVLKTQALQQKTWISKHDYRTEKKPNSRMQQIRSKKWNSAAQNEAWWKDSRVGCLSKSWLSLEEDISANGIKTC